MERYTRSAAHHIQATTTVNTYLKGVLRWTIAVTAATLGFAFFGVGGAQALTISPPSIEFGVYPGQQAEIEVKLYNEDASQTVTVTSETTSFTSGETPGEPLFADAESATDIGRWITVEGGAITLEPLARQNVQVRVNVPVDAEPGGHYGAILFTFKNPNTTDAGQIAIDAKVATLLLVRVEGGEITESATVQSFGTTTGDKWFAHLPVQFTMQYKNTGTIHLKPKGAITVKNSFGKQVAEIPFNVEKGATLPGATRRYDKEVWQVNDVQPVTGNAWSAFWKSFANERDNFAIGKFTATASLVAGSGDSVASTTAVSFWVFPWHVVLVYGIVIVIIVILLVLLIIRYNAWIRKRPTSPTQPPVNPEV